MSPAGQAVFLSYASQDADAARKIRDALQAAGLEVWFDQNELRGGDAWDQKIRRQIKECALFMPIISATTQARPEGYFRLEWKLAVDRSHLMADDAPFLFPVVIDDTAEPAARVPDRFREVQWTRLDLRETPASLAERIAKLLGGAQDGTQRPSGPSGSSRPPAARGRLWRWKIIPVVGVIVGIGFAVVPLWRAFRPAAPVAAGPEDARSLVAKARALYEPWDGATREDFALAEEMAKRATTLSPTDGETWAAYGVVACAQIIFSYDRSLAKREAARTAAERAVKLAPASPQARFALAFYYRFNDTTRAESERILHELVKQEPANKLFLRTLGSLFRSQRRYEDAIVFFDRAAALPGGDPVAVYNKYQALMGARRYGEAEAVIDGALAIQPTGYLYRAKASFLLVHRGQLDEAAAMMAKVPPVYLLEDNGAYLACQVWLWRREPDKALAALSGVPREIAEGDFSGPFGLLKGQAHEMAGRTEAARIEWRAALRVVEQQLVTQPNSERWIYWQARLFACLDLKPEAERALRLFEELSRKTQLNDDTIPILLKLGRIDPVLAGLEARATQLEAANNLEETTMVKNFWSLDPSLDPLREQPRFKAALARLAKISR